MPKNQDFSFSVLVDDKPLAEYSSNGEYYVDSSVQSSTSYKIRSKDGNEVSENSLSRGVC